jgi:hypothetical protein
MPRSRRFIAAAASGALLALPAPAVAQQPASGQECAVVAAPAPRTFAVDLADGARATVTDRYGGAFQRNRLFVQWTVRLRGFGERPPLAGVQYVVDGRLMHTDDTARVRDGEATWQWATLSRRFATGDHVLTIRLLGAAGSGNREMSIPFQATDCPYATFSGAALRRPRPLAVLSWASAAEGPGPDLTSVLATLRGGARFAAPAVRPGAAVGWLDAGRRYTLIAPRSGPTLLAVGPLRVLLDVRRRQVAVSGLPAGTTSVVVRLRAGILRPSAGCSRAEFDAQLRGSAGDVAALRTRDARRC